MIHRATTWRNQLLLLALLLILGSTFFYWNQRVLLYSTTVKQDVIFGADNIEVMDAIQGVTFDKDMRKHILFSPIMSTLVLGLDSIPYISFNRAVRLVYALLAGLNICGMYILLLKRGQTKISALLFTGIYAFSFANLVIYSIPETYSLSNLLIVIYLIWLLQAYNRLTEMNGLVLAVVAGVAGLFNYPLLALTGIHILMQAVYIPWRRWLLIALANVVVTIAFFLSVNYLLYGWDFLSFFVGYSNQWASWRNLFSFDRIGTVLTNFYLFGVVSPVKYLPAILGWQALIGYVSSVLAGAAASLWALLLFVNFCGCGAFNRALWVWMAGITLFYIYFNPVEAMLYASQIMLPLMLVTADGWGRLGIPARWGVGLLLLLLAVNNCLALYTGVPGA